ncbi:DMT family transporter [uncultured Amnibacterium sp.]|uniref:DMT family transporter n=1 Tax=uncultured Amnibacterium sp. TaxID=1631851 RepID=UPI0035C95CA2
MAALLLIGAIVVEVTATLALRVATHGRPRWYAGVVIGYLAAFTFLGLSLSAGMPLGVAYGIWAASGVAITAVASRLLFKEPLTALMSLGVALIAGGVLLIELGAAH